MFSIFKDPSGRETWSKLAFLTNGVASPTGMSLTGPGVSLRPHFATSQEVSDTTLEDQVPYKAKHVSLPQFRNVNHFQEHHFLPEFRFGLEAFGFRPGVSKKVVLVFSSGESGSVRRVQTNSFGLLTTSLGK